MAAPSRCAVNTGAFGQSPAATGATADKADSRPVFRVIDFGAVADGKTLNTQAFRKAIQACAASAEGGHVEVPSGTYLTGPIQLMSNVDFHVDAGAVILFSRRFEDYPLLITGFEGRRAVQCTSPISGDNLQNVSITGPGSFDGQGEVWRAVKQSKLTAAQWDDLVKSGGVVDEKSKTWWPSQAALSGNEEYKKLREAGDATDTAGFERFRELLRPSLLLLSNCRDVVLDGPTFRNSPCWNIHLLLSDNIKVHNVTSFNYLYAQNGDGLDIDSCRNVAISDCTVNAGDDDICLKSGRDAEGRRLGRPTENVTISNCTVGWGHGGIVIGSEMSGGVRNITVNDCIFKGTDAGLRFKSVRGRGGVVENVQINNISMSDIKGAAVMFNMSYMVKKPIPEPLSERTPAFRKFQIRNVTCDNAKRALELSGLPELALTDITLENIHITADQGVNITDVHDITLRDVSISARTLPILQTQNATGLTMERVETLTLPALPKDKIADKSSDTATDN